MARITSGCGQPGKTGRKGVTFHDFQFFDEERLRPLLEKQKGIVQVMLFDPVLSCDAVLQRCLLLCWES